MKTFKTSLFGLVLIFFSLSALAQTKPTYPSSLHFLEKELVLKDQQFNNGASIAEYTAKSDSLKRYSVLFAVRYETKKLDLKAAATALAEKAVKRRSTGDTLANAQVFENQKKGVCVVDFLMSENNVVEHNIFSYFSHDKGTGVYQMARRFYITKKKSNDADLKKFIQEIETNRGKYLNELTKPDLPKPIAPIGK